MVKISHKHVRHARDRLVDFIGFGKTYPLRDLDIKDEGLTVPFNASAKIPIEVSQPDVRYSLYTREDQPVFRSPGRPAESMGNGETLLLESPAIADDVTYKIRAAKFDPDRHTYLHQTATLKVGLDVSLQAVILNAELLDPANEAPTNITPRIVDYGANVDVRLFTSQEGVDYHLMAVVKQSENAQPTEVVLSEKVRGTRGDIELRSRKIYEDTDIRIRADKTFEPAEGRPDQTALLEIVLPLKVRANTANAVTVRPNHIIDYRQSTTVIIAASQTSATYRIHQRRIPDEDIIHGEVDGQEVLMISVPDEPDVQILKPALSSVWQALEGYLPVGDPQPGNGGELQLPLDGLTDDSLVVVEAIKEHQASSDGTGTANIASAVPLQQPVVVLVRPDPAPALSLKVPVEGSSTGGRIQVSNGQPGVFYYLHDSRNNKVIGRPAYFHKRDDGDGRLNKGLGQLKIDVDFVPAVDHPRDDTVEPGALAVTPPEPPIVETEPVLLEATLTFRALKAQTRVGADLNRSAVIPAGPEVAPERTVVDHGASTRIRIIASRSNELYQLMRDGSPSGDPIKGTGNNRLLNTGPLVQDPNFEILITRADDPIPVERIVSVKIWVRPDPALVVGAVHDTVDEGSGTRIRIAASQPGVQYQLSIGQTPSGDAVAGNGHTIELPTGPLTADTTFSVRAAKIANADINIQLDQQVQVKINPAAARPLPEPL